MTNEEWIATLRLSHMWGFESVRNKSIEMLEGYATVGMIQRLKLANEFEITSWIRPAYQYLMTRAEDLKVSDVPWLGPDFVQRVTKAREERTKLFLLRILSRDIVIPQCPTCRKGLLKLDDSMKPSGPQAGPSQLDSVKWTFRCNDLTSPLHGRLSVFNNVPLKASWTLEELVLSASLCTQEPVNSLMKKDVGRLIDTFLPVY